MIITTCWKRVGEGWSVGSVLQQLLAPDDELLGHNRQCHDLAFVALIARLRRDRPYVVVFPPEEVTYDDEHVSSLERIDTAQGIVAICVGYHDILPFVPLPSEEGGLLLLPTAPAGSIPSHEDVTTKWDGVLVTTVDELTLIQHADPNLGRWLNTLPMTEARSG